LITLLKRDFCRYGEGIEEQKEIPFEIELKNCKKLPKVKVASVWSNNMKGVGQ